MLENSKAYNGFAVDDIDKAVEFYRGTLGLKTSVLDEGNLIEYVTAQRWYGSKGREVHRPGDRSVLERGKVLGGDRCSARQGRWDIGHRSLLF